MYTVYEGEERAVQAAEAVEKAVHKEKTEVVAVEKSA